MEYGRAKLELLRHAGMTEDYERDGFVGCLRPFSGLKEDNFHTVVESILSVGQSFSTSNSVEKSIVSAIWQLTSTTRLWAIDDEGMLVRNQLISHDQRMRLRRWITIIESLALNLLRGQEPHDTIHGYCEYVASFGWGTNHSFFVPLLVAALESDDLGDKVQGYCESIVRLGPEGRAIKSALVRARERKWDWYEPTDRCEAEMHMHIDRALAAIDETPELSSVDR